MGNVKGRFILEFWCGYFPISMVLWSVQTCNVLCKVDHSPAKHELTSKAASESVILRLLQVGLAIIAKERSFGSLFEH